MTKKKSEKTREINFEMNDQEFSNYLEQLKADHATKMAALEEETAPLRKPVKKLDEKIAKEWFLMLHLMVRFIGYVRPLYIKII